MTTECYASVCVDICAALMEEAKKNNVTYLTICVPCYNETSDELLETFESLMVNIEFIKLKVCAYISIS